MFAHILFEFAGNSTPRQYYAFELPTEVGDIKKGQIVVVEGKEPGEKLLGVFVERFYVDKIAQRYPDKYPSRKKVLKKAHKNSLISLVKKRYELFKEIELTKGAYKKYRRAFKRNKDLDKETIRKNMIRNLIVASEMANKAKGNRRVFRFGNMQIIMNDQTIIDLIPLAPKTIRWVKPDELFQIANDYVQKVENELLEKEKQV